MDFKQLRYFVAVAEAGHITRAAALLGMAQPPLSQQLRALERQLGLALFTRHAKGVTLTSAGQLLLDDARRLLDGLQAARQRMALVAQGRAGTLAVGFTSSAAAHAFTPRLLRACRRDSPDLSLQLCEANAAELTEALQTGRLQVALLRVPVARPTGLVFETLLSEPAVLALPVEHALATAYGAEAPVPLQALQGQPLILTRRPGAPGLYAALLSLLAQAGVQVQVVAEVDRMMGNLNLVASGAGLTVVPASMQGVHPHSVVYRRLADAPALQAPLTLCHRPGGLEPAARLFLALARRMAAADAGPDPATGPPA